MQASFNLPSNNSDFDGLVAALSLCDQVEAILLAGSRASGSADPASDYDLYVYLNGELPVSTRQQITDRYFSYMELDNQFWETEDDGYLNDGSEIELIYRSLDWLDGEIERVLIRHQASLGYTTSLWANLLDSVVLFDRSGRAVAMQQTYSLPYPQQLKIAILRKNYPILKERIPAYYHQIEKAVARDDLVSLNHRVAAFLASYFDILFAINELPHPGEKKLLALAQARCTYLPKDFVEDLTALLVSAGDPHAPILERIDGIVANLDALLKELGL
jgi:predicted nucleotidyltransferase